MFGAKIKVSNALYENIKKASQIAGCSSVEEFVEGILNRETQRIITQAGKDGVTDKEVQDIANKLKGLGYLE